MNQNKKGFSAFLNKKLEMLIFASILETDFSLNTKVTDFLFLVYQTPQRTMLNNVHRFVRVV